MVLGEKEELEVRELAKRLSLMQSELARRDLQSKARLTAATEDQSEMQPQQLRVQESLKAQLQETKQRLRDAEQKAQATGDEAERLRKDLQEAKREMERSKASNKLEVECLRHFLDIEAQSRISAERIAQSKLAEKDFLLDLKAAELENLKADLEQARQHHEALETEARRAREEKEARVHALTLRCSQFEAELRSKHKQVAEMQGRLEEQRSYVEQLHAQLHKALQEAGQAHALALKDYQDRVSGLEAELLTSRQRCEHLVRNKADLQQELAKQGEARAAFQAELQEQRTDAERLGQELERERQLSATFESECDRLRNELQDSRSLVERLAMSHEELRTRQADFSYERQWLTGALEESRRSLRASLKPTSSTVMDTYRICQLEQQLKEELEKHQKTSADLTLAQNRMSVLEAEKDAFRQWFSKASDCRSSTPTAV